MTNNTATPMTDARAFEILGHLHTGTESVVPTDFARDLERKLNALNQPVIESEWQKLTAALLELVECECLHDRIEKHDFATYEGYSAACADYRRRKPLAWAAAWDAVSPTLAQRRRLSDGK